MRIRHLVYCFLVGTVNAATAQDMDNMVYRLMTDKIGQDTVVRRAQWHSMKVGVASGRMTKQDSANYVDRVKKRTLRLSRFRDNSSLEKLLSHHLEYGGVLSKRFSNKELGEIINTIPPERAWDSTLVASGIHLLDDEEIGGNGHHRFSDPIPLENGQYLIFHGRYHVNIATSEEFLFIRPDREKGYEIMDMQWIAYD